MDEQALNDAYNLFTRQGYNGTIDQFKKLISSNSQALNDSYQIFRAEGYNGDINNYSTLVGVKKKASSTVSSPDSKVGMEDLQNGFDFSPTIFEAPAVLTPKKQKEYIEEQKGKPAPVVIETPTPETTPKGWETYQAPSKEDEQGLGLNILSSLNKGIYKNLIGTPIKALGTFIEGTTALLPRQIRSETGKGVISESLINFGNYFNEAIDEISPQDKEFKDSLTDQFAQAFGQVASTILTAGVGGAGNVASKGAAMLAKPLGAKAAALAATKEAGKQITGPAGISSALTMGQSEYERAKEAGATDEQAFEAFYKNAVTGSVLETIPVMQFMKRFNTATNGGVLNYIKTKGVAGLTGGVEELTTEVLQTIYGNKTAQEIYNENQNIFEGVGNAGGIGFGVGFLLNAMGANAKVLRRDGKNSEADILENQIEGIQSRIENGPPPVYKINGLKIESPEIVNDMIERMDAPDLFKLNIEIDNDPELKTKLQEKIVTSSIIPVK
jgi:D-arabinose 5-phosphate isomerase GutQ